MKPLTTAATWLFVALLSGAAGLGKTLLISRLFESLESRIEPRVHVVFPKMATEQLIVFLGSELTGDSMSSLSMSEAIRGIQVFLANNSANGQHALLVIDEVGYIPFEADAANLFFQLVSARYERASVIVTSNKPFGRWGEVFGDPVVAAAMIDRLVHHAEVVNLKGDSYRLKDRDLGRIPTDNTE